ncbi:MAG: 5'-nucleotidase C-terminal domain-containing protein [Acidimicrobiales bacterium]|nr:5'-nucleotidase C-terminal domain-containing protein [Acidimicrobiales bacterium]
MKKLLFLPVALVAMLLATVPGGGAGASAYGFPTISVGDAAASEADGTLDFVVELSHPLTRAVRFTVDIEAPGTGVVGNTTGLERRRFVIPPGHTSYVVSVPIIDDDVAEADASVVLSITAAWSARRGDTTAIGTIVDDDGFVLNALHVNDHHSHLQEESVTLDLGGQEVEFPLGGFSRVVTQLKALESELAGQNVVKIHAGDALTGTLYFTLFQGEADAAMMNAVCFDILEMGNHEFDAGDGVLAGFLDDLAAGDCDTATLGANIVPAVGTPLLPDAASPYLAPYVIEQYGADRVAYIGIDVAQKTKVSSSPLETTQFLDEVQTAQRYIDEVSAMGVDKIVVVTHQGYQQDLDMASMLSGVDAIIGGDSHTLLGDFAQYGLNPGGPYPTMATDAAGKRVCVAQAWQYSYVVGHLTLRFNAAGDLASCGGTPHLLLGQPEDAAGAALAAAAAGADPQLTIVGTDATADAILAAYAAEVDLLGEEVIGQVTGDGICAGRFPNDGRSTICGEFETPNGGEVQQLVTEAFLARAFRADIALQNSGGVRVDLLPGDLTIARAYELLPFANTLVELEMTGAEIQASLEEGLGNVLDAGGSTGAYPYGAGIRWDVDVSQPFGSRFSNIEVMPKGATSWGPLDLTATYIVVANSFMVGGGDGYATLKTVSDSGRSVDTFLDYAQTFVDYVEEDLGGVVNAPTEFSTKSYTPLPGPTS